MRLEAAIRKLIPIQHNPRKRSLEALPVSRSPKLKIKSIAARRETKAIGANLLYIYKAFFAASRKKTLVLSIIIPSLVMSEKVIIIIQTSAAECFTP
jgi:hypothetical protein